MSDVIARDGLPLGDLAIGEVARWEVGVCTVFGAHRDGDGVITPISQGGMVTSPDVIVVEGETGPLGVYDAGRDLMTLQGEVVDDIRREMASL